jgi:serine/threonine-protein kinase RsbW
MRRSNPAVRSVGPDMRVAIEVDIPSDVSYIERIVSMVTRQCQDHCFAPQLCTLNVPVALSEALSNAILRGNAEDPAKHVKVNVTLDDKELVLEITDEGSGFDMDTAASDPTTPDNLLREDGRGLFLMKRLMDRVERFNEGGNVVRLTLKRA